MNYNNTTDAYLRSIAKIGPRQSVRPLESFDLSGWISLWKPVGKILLVLFPLFLIVHMFVASSVSETNGLATGVANQRHSLMDRKIELIAQKTRLWSAENIKKLAGEKMALYENSGNQVGRFNPRKGRFIYTSGL